ncbi:hypothetical protein PHMEG_00016206 [Phytophthora megakarya]|uniref:ZSWIM1/3 RNaseH-like domain-containing protein n=1 Tax=Phytophthora megakarya TaxID=4795 RepID=A0A225VZC7_9STRA|nr:hypothetical protein PHMEG_00016206 [Phytophthora megakarya]
MRSDSYASPDSNVRATEVLQDFSEGTGNVVNLFRDVTTKRTSDITFQSTMYRHFRFMVTDKLGCRAFAQHAFFVDETQVNMNNAVSAFKGNKAAWKNLSSSGLEHIRYKRFCYCCAA